ncbi:cytochrome P450 [Rhodococcus sp. NPDC059968]|uniref:cytochrome P450 n=1 Tax=Rhodococcus sp. NPDC059968 TaxID=3347017 RepID=UPI0036724751
MGVLRPPHPPKRVPLIGDIIGLDPVKPMQNTARILGEIGPIYQRRILGMRLTFVGGADIADEANDDATWQKAVPRPLQLLRPIAEDGLFTAYNDEPNWHKAHAILAPAFTQSSMRSYHDTMVQVVDEMCSAWDGASGDVDVAAEMTKLALETIGRCGFGYRFDSFGRSEVDPFLPALKDMLEYVQAQGVPVPGRKVVDALTGRTRQHQRNVDYMFKVVDDVIADRQANPHDEPRDLLDLMLTTKDPETGEQLDARNVRNQILTFLVAGHETTASALSFALYLLATHPDEAAKARAEVDELWSTDAAVRFEEVAKLRTVRRVIDETMRLWPASPGYFREAKQDTVLDGRYPFKQGEWLMVVLQQVHRDPAVWGDDADQFRPDRFQSEEVRARPGHGYKPFGTGLRACIGRQFAYHEMILALATILHRYDFAADPDYTLDIAEQMTLKPAGFRLSITRRAGADASAPAPAK